MARPQKENGYTPIANEIIDNIIQLPLNGTQWRILAVIWRYTYGFSRKEHSVSEAFISKATGISKRFVSSELKKLIEQKIILITKPSTYIEPRILKFNKDYEQWYRTIVLQVNDSSTGEQKQASTVEQSFYSTDEQSFYQDKQKDKQKEKQKDICTKFIPPTVEQIRKYCKERNNSVDAEKWIDFYISKGWMIGKNKMKDWKAAVRTWERNNKQQGKKAAQSGNFKQRDISDIDDDKFYANT
jgi:phage replication O-like protein O